MFSKKNGILLYVAGALGRHRTGIKAGETLITPATVSSLHPLLPRGSGPVSAEPVRVGDVVY